MFTFIHLLCFNYYCYSDLLIIVLFLYLKNVFVFEANFCQKL